jgi:hypothetical protein
MVIAPKLLNSKLPPARQCELLLEEPRSQAGAAGTFPPANLEQGLPALVCIQVENQGNRPAEEFMVEWNPDAWGLITPSPGTVSSQVEGLATSQSTVVVFEFIYNQAGTFHTVAKVDAFGNVDELNEANNLATVDVTVDAAGPDLVITSLSISPQSPTQGEEIDVSVTVQNVGNRPAGPFIVEWNPDAFGLITPSPGTLSTQIDGLAPSQSSNVTFEFTYHEHGEFRTIAKADAFNDVAELNEANNMSIENVVVSPGNIDLQIVSFSISPSSPTRGSKATASILVRNYGTYPTGPFWVKWKLMGEDSSSGPIAKVDGLHPYSYGSAFNSTTVELESTFRIAGDYTSWAMADFFDNVIETNENNNTKTRFVRVQPRETTLGVTFDSLKVYHAFEDGADRNGEWETLMFVIDPSAECHTSLDVGPTNVDIDEEGFQCTTWGHGAVDDGDTIYPNKSFNVTLVESMPLVFGMLALEVEGTSAPEEPGYAFAFWSAVDYKGVGSATAEGQGCQCCGGHCYDLNYTIDVISEPPVPFSAEDGELLPPPEYVVLPEAIANLLPDNAQLPEGLVRQCRVFLPLVNK